MKKRRYSFVGKKHTLKIDPDIQTNTEQYVENQLEIMRKYGDAPVLTRREQADLVYDVAQHPQMIRNRKKEREAKEAAQRFTVGGLPLVVRAKGK